ncbi:GNAT family N-acetyltransferase [Streptantibioticus ferralitis]|uniref:GNAT family N-acetyltransferase n=1 Tax=Streptantibioticus ferralitis TaxID=236510 RepID=A0ABT5Z9X4_9ACTN|nr:GNAT family N-acetyltransferase [Streptantibioticus ferralitis]MDF2260630.1 GNAT family N-acetyltransferase [Streptantibioticus ferralitis]
MLRPVELEAYGLTLRPWEEADVKAALRGLSDPDFNRWNTPSVRIEDEEGALRFIRSRRQGWLRGDMLSFAVAEDGEVRGHVAVQLSDPRMRNGRVGYWVIRENRGRRIASRALETLTRWAFRDLGLHRMELGHDLDNEASCAVARRCAYAYEGLLRGARIDLDGVPRDLHLHARLVIDPAPEAPSAP